MSASIGNDKMRRHFRDHDLGDFMPIYGALCYARGFFVEGWNMRAHRNFLLFFGVAILAGLCLLPCPALAQSETTPALPLATGWRVQSSADIHGGGGAVLSKTGFATPDWYSTNVPSTVVAALVENKLYSDPYFSTNLRSFPGMSYKIGDNFSDDDMPKNSPFRVPWWYRVEFQAPADWQGKSVWLDFHGINYRANIWLNGQQIAKSEDAAGSFRRYEFEVSRMLSPGAANALAVEVFPPTPHDLAITFVDWNPMPPDKDMGIWGKVFLRASGAVSVRHPQ